MNTHGIEMDARAARALAVLSGCIASAILLVAAPPVRADAVEPTDDSGPSWLAGDHHIHSHFSVD